MENPFRKYVKANSIRRDADEVSRLAKQYVAEETIEPLKKLGRYVAWGCAGSLLIGLGTVFLLIGLLRLLQTETTVFHGNWSWAPYLIVVVAGLGVIGLVAWRIFSGPAQRRLPKKTK